MLAISRSCLPSLFIATVTVFAGKSAAAPMSVLGIGDSIDDWGRLLGDTAAVTALLDRLLHHGHLLKCGPRSWRTKKTADLQSDNQPR